MKTNFLLLAILVVIGGGLRAEPVGPQMSRTQSIDLVKGWNAVFLEVEPLDVAPSKVFLNQPVDMVAGYFPQEASTQFVTNPGTQLFCRASPCVTQHPSILKIVCYLPGEKPFHHIVGADFSPAFL